MHDMSAGWLMTTLDSSPVMVAAVQAATTLPVCLLALPAGTLADAMDKRRLLLIVQWLMLLLAGLLGGLVLTGKVTEWSLLAVTFALGACTAIMAPTWQSIMPRLVPREDLPAAIALHAVGMNIARAIGPALSGLIIAVWGIGWPFVINALSFLAVIVVLQRWRGSTPPQANNERFHVQLRAGLAHARDNRPLLNTLKRSALFFLFGSAYWALLPLVAHEQLSGGPGLFGLLVGSIGLGAVVGALLLPPLRARWGLDRTVAAGTLGTAVALAGFALGRSPAVGLVTALLAGASWIAALSSLNVAAQLAVPDWVRARGMALYTSVFYGCLALGSLFWGQLGTHLGLTATLLCAALGALLALWPARKLPIRTPVPA
jgi:predicted MFS family arabinose efflux permease